VEVKDRFYELDTLMWDALTEHEINEQIQQIPRLQEKTKAFRERGPDLLKVLEHEVQERLWSSQSIAP